MKIKKVNENWDDSIMNHNTIHVDNNILNVLTDFDIKKIHRSGRKIYSVTEDFEILEITSLSQVKYNKSNVNTLFPYLLLITEEYMSDMKEKVNLIKKIKELSDNKIHTLFELVRALSEENGGTN